MVPLSAFCAIFFGICLLLSDAVVGHAAEGPMNAVVSAQSVKVGSRADSVLTVSDKVGLTDLVMRLSPLRIVLSMECDGFCLQAIDGQRIVIQIFYDFEKERIDRIVSYDPRAIDSSGNKIGTSLAKAAGSRLICFEGESQVCNSLTGEGPTYFASADEKCSVKKIGDTDNFEVPDCVKIEGFAAERRSIYFPRQRFAGLFHTIESEIEEEYAACKQRPEVGGRFLVRKDINGDAALTILSSTTAILNAATSHQNIAVLVAVVHRSTSHPKRDILASGAISFWE